MVLLTARAWSTVGSSSVELELQILSLVEGVCCSPTGRAYLRTTPVPRLLTLYCLGSSALGERALIVLRALVGDTSVSDGDHVDALMSFATSEPVEECMQAVRALQAVLEREPAALKRAAGHAPLAMALKEALEQGRIPPKRPAAWRLPYEGGLNAIQAASELLEALTL